MKSKGLVNAKVHAVEELSYPPTGSMRSWGPETVFTWTKMIPTNHLGMLELSRKRLHHMKIFQNELELVEMSKIMLTFRSC